MNPVAPNDFKRVMEQERIIRSSQLMGDEFECDRDSHKYSRFGGIKDGTLVYGAVCQKGVFDKKFQVIYFKTNFN